MRWTLITHAAAAVLATGLLLPAAAQAATTSAAGAPAPQKSLFVAGYEQFGCQDHAYPVYREIQGIIIVPTAVNVDSTPGISSDILNIGSFPSGVSAGLAVDNSGGHAFYTPYGQWGSGQVTAPISARPGNKLQVTIEYKGSSGWLVKIVDQANGERWSQVKPDASDQPCQAWAYEQSAFPAYDYLTQTTPVAFDDTRVWWAKPGKAGTGKLLGAPPSGATLFRYNMVNSENTVIATTSAPAGDDSDFTVTDAPVKLPATRTPTLAGYEVTGSQSPTDTYTAVQATFKLPKITRTNPDSAAFAYYFVGIGNSRGNGVMAGVEETMAYGAVTYQAFAVFGGQLDAIAITVTPGDRIKASVTVSNDPVLGQGWSLEVYDQTTGHRGSVTTYAKVNVSQYDAEVVQWRPPNPFGPGYFPLAATTPVTFDHVTFTNAAGATYPFQTVLPGGSLQRLQMQTGSPATTIAATSQPDSDKDGFTVQDGATVPAPPKS